MRIYLRPDHRLNSLGSVRNPVVYPESGERLRIYEAHSSSAARSVARPHGHIFLSLENTRFVFSWKTPPIGNREVAFSCSISSFLSVNNQVRVIGDDSTTAILKTFCRPANLHVFLTSEHFRFQIFFFLDDRYMLTTTEIVVFCCFFVKIK